MLKSIHLKEGLRIFRRAKIVKSLGIKQYTGDANQILAHIIRDCWNKRFFQTSAGHFCQFWTRDFAWCAQPLINLKHHKEVEKTVHYAMSIFKRHDKITTAISPCDVPFDFPYYSSDSIPYFIRTMRITNKEVIEENKEFLNKKINEYFGLVIDKDTGLIRRDKHFSSIKDHAKRKSSCYDNCMVAMLNNELKKIKILDNPFKNYNYKSIIKKNFWKSTHFIDDLSGNNLLTGDANIFPFWLGVFTEKSMIRKAINKIRESKLDKPFPLRYYHKKTKKQEMISIELFARNYERNTVWCHLGPLYIQIVNKVNKELASYYLNQYRKIIEKHKNFLEVFHPNQEPYKTFFYHSDEGMLWSSIILDLLKWQE